MKMIHCADLHLDSRMESGLPPEKARERRMELLHTFTKMVDMAAEDGVEAILLCGDLFDAGQVTVRARNCVLNAVRKYPQIFFHIFLSALLQAAHLHPWRNWNTHRT